mmetsp:Transcript_42033/g.69441  ORF Transcript_42033/g.69441 Transcript_42033/m.69441 type:complete len:221 (+) Transcript_42033:63-725(+)
MAELFIEGVEVVKSHVEDLIDSHPDVFPPALLEKVKSLTGLPSIATVLIIIAILAGMACFEQTQTLLIYTAGLIYPLKATHRQIKLKKDAKPWLAYWICFILYMRTRSMVPSLIPSLPYEFVWQLVFVIFLCHPSTQGAALIHDRVTRPLLYPALDLRAAPTPLARGGGGGGGEAEAAAAAAALAEAEAEAGELRAAAAAAEASGWGDVDMMGSEYSAMI